MTERIVVTIENLPADRDVEITINVPGKPVEQSAPAAPVAEEGGARA
jgi:hypothetical protein